MTGSTVPACVALCAILAGCDTPNPNSAADAGGEVSQADCVKACQSLVGCGACIDDGSGGCGTSADCASATCKDATVTCVLGAADCTAVLACNGPTTAGDCPTACKTLVGCGACVTTGFGICATLAECASVTCGTSLVKCVTAAGTKCQAATACLGASGG